MNYRFVKVPECIDLTQPLMPQRGEDDDYFYGVDPAWLGEALMVWCSLCNYHTYDQQEMSEYPAVSDWHNFLRALCRSIKTHATNFGDFFSYLPGVHRVDRSDLNPISFDDVPEDVKVGDPLRKTDISDLYDWMGNKHPKYIRRWMYDVEYEITSNNTTHGDEGNRSWEEFSAPGDNTIYNWEWFYIHAPDDSPFAHIVNGGAWRRDVRTLRIGGKIYQTDDSFINGANVYVNIAAYWTGLENTKSLVVPLSNCTYSMRGGELYVQGYIDAQTAKDIMQPVEKDYKTGMVTEDGVTTGSDDVEIWIGIASTMCYLEIKDDYLVP